MDFKPVCSAACGRAGGLSDEACGESHEAWARRQKVCRALVRESIAAIDDEAFLRALSAYNRRRLSGAKRAGAGPCEPKADE